MSTKVFDSKFFNGEVFKGYVARIPKTRTNELKKSRAIVSNPDVARSLKDGDGGNYIVSTMKDIISGTKPQNYDGQTNITSQSTTTYKQGKIVVGRSQAWTEKDFSYDITGGQDFLENVAQQISDYWEDVDQDTLLSVLKGVFNMTGGENKKFVDTHTHDISKNTVNNQMNGTTLNTAMQRALGQHKSKFALAIMHSMVATNLENLNLLEYLKYTDKNGMTRNLAMGTLNGRLVLVDDGMPAETVTEGYVKVDATVEGALKIVESGATEGQIDKTNVTPTIGGYSAKVNDYVVLRKAGVEYTTFVLGEGAIELTDCGVKTPYEPHRDPYKNGGEDTLISRQRKCISPYGISFTQSSVSTESPTDEELEKGANWELVKSANGSKTIDIKAIPIARIISRG